MKNVVITGSGGFLGNQVLNSLLMAYKKIHIKAISRNKPPAETSFYKENRSSIEYIIGDITDKDLIKNNLGDVDTIIHLAAVKDISFCEKNPVEAVKTNVQGTINLLNFFNGNTFLAISSNKAINTQSCYGATKLLMEKILLSKSNENPHARYLIIRSGNIFGSTGSVVDKWKKQIRINNEISLTHPNITRFFIQGQDLSEYIIKILETGKSGYIYIPSHRTMQLGTLAQAMIEVYGDSKTKITVTGLSSTEKKHEFLCFPDEYRVINDMCGSSDTTYKMTLDEIKRLLSKNDCQ